MFRTKDRGRRCPSCLGQVQLAMFGIASTLPYVKTGKLKALAVPSSKRLAVLPDVPTVAESAFPGFERTFPGVSMRPPGRRKTLLRRFTRRSCVSCSFPTSLSGPGAVGQQPVGSTPAQLAARMRQERARWAKVIQDAGIKIEQ